VKLNEGSRLSLRADLAGAMVDELALDAGDQLDLELVELEAAH
jgi:hypothetical protein